MAKEKSCVFYGMEISELEKESLSKKLNHFLGEYFAWFRDGVELFELKARNDALPNILLRFFGDDNLYYDITAIAERDIRFDINDERDRHYLTFYADRVSGRLIKVFIRRRNVSAIHKALDLLIKPSWVD